LLVFALEKFRLVQNPSIDKPLWEEPVQTLQVPVQLQWAVFGKDYIGYFLRHRHLLIVRNLKNNNYNKSEAKYQPILNQ
jgi:hypothetical protein